MSAIVDMDTRQLEDLANSKAKKYKTVYSQDFTFKDVLKDLERYDEDYPMTLYNLLKEKHFRDGFLAGIFEYKDGCKTKKDELDKNDWIYICDKGYPKNSTKKYIWAVLTNEGTIEQVIETTETIHRIYGSEVSYGVHPTWKVYAYKEMSENPIYKGDK